MSGIGRKLPVVCSGFLANNGYVFKCGDFPSF